MEKIKMYNREGDVYLVPVGTKKVPSTCYRCGGCGEYSYNQIDGTVCYGCNGSGKRLGKGYTEKQWQARQKREEAKRRKAEEASRKKEAELLEIRKANAPVDDRIIEVVELLMEGASSPSKSVRLLTDMLSRARTLSRPYTQKQKDLVEKIASDHLKLKEEGAKTSHVGEIGQRMERELTCKRVYEGTSHYGLFVILTLEDSEGNTFVYKGSKPLLAKDESAVITFTVKAHETFREVKQTIINRPKVK